MNMRHFVRGALVAALASLCGCTLHPHMASTPGGGLLRHCWFDHHASGRAWIVHQYFEPQRYDYHRTCWSPMMYDPCDCCWQPGCSEAYAEQAPADGEIIHGIPEPDHPEPDHPELTDPVPDQRGPADVDPAIMPGELAPPLETPKTIQPMPSLQPMPPSLPDSSDGETPETPSPRESSENVDDVEPIIRPAAYFDPRPTQGAPVMQRIPQG